LLCFPGDQTIFYINLPTAGTGAINAVGRAHNLVVLPALPVAFFPGSVLIGDNAMPIRESLNVAGKKSQMVE